MLQTIREHTQGWIAGTIISIIILTFALWGIHSYFVSGGANQVVASVNGTDITNRDLASAYERLRRQFQQQYGANAITAINEPALKSQALKALIDMEALSQAANNQGFYVSDEQIDNYLQTLPEFQVNGQFSIDRLQQALLASQLTNKDFINLVRTSLLIGQPKVGIVYASFALPDATDAAIKLINQERNLAYLSVPLSHFSDAQLIVPEADKIAYYDAHKNDFMTPEQVSIDYVELNQADIAKTIKPTESELKRFYEDNTSAYLSSPTWKLMGVLVPVSEKATDQQITEAKTKAETLFQNAQKDDAFEKITSNYPRLKLKSGFLTRQQIPSQYSQAVNEINQPNTVVPPIKTAQGFAVIKIVDYQPGKPQSYETIKDKLQTAYAQQKAEEKYAEFKERLADITYENPDSLNEASKELNLPIKKTEFFTKDKPATGITQYAKIRNAAFSNEVLVAKTNSDVIPISGDTAIVLRLNSHINTSLLPLSAVIDQIATVLKKQSAEKQSEQLAAIALNRLKHGESPNILASQYKLNWQQTGFIGRYSTKVDNAILDAAFRLPNIGVNSKQDYYALTRTPDGFAVIALKGVREGKVSNAEQETVFAEQAQSSNGSLEYELYKQSQIDNAKVKVK